MNTTKLGMLSSVAGLLSSLFLASAYADPKMQITSIATDLVLPEFRAILHDVPAGTLKVVLGLEDITSTCRILNPGQNPQGLKCTLTPEQWPSPGEYRLFVTVKGASVTQTATYDYSIAAVGKDGRNGVQGPAGPIGPQGAGGSLGTLYWRKIDVTLASVALQDFKVNCQPDSNVLAGGFSELSETGSSGAVESAPSGDKKGWFVKFAQGQQGRVVRLYALCRAQPIL